MTESLYFYDLETSGVDAHNQRIMQFAGQRTTLDLQCIGEPDDIIVRLDKDVLPDPDAIVLTGITPQSTWTDSYTEKEFLQYFIESIALPETVFVGFNTIRFDEEFIRQSLYRNFYDAYEWIWKDGRGHWDLLDVCRMTRALRPDGIVWPVGEDGTKINRLELLTSANNLTHSHAHNALSDVLGSIELAKLLRDKQQKLFNYLYTMRTKTAVEALIQNGQPFVYTSGRYPSEYEKTSIAVQLKKNSDGSIWVYDLRHNPKEYTGSEERSAIKRLRPNKCPAIAPLGVMDDASWERIGITLKQVQQHFACFKDEHARLERCIPEKQFETHLPNAGENWTPLESELRLYDGFFAEQDKKTSARVRTMSAAQIADFDPEFSDPRLKGLFLLYKARNFPQSLVAEEREVYEQYISEKLSGRVEEYMERLAQLAQKEYLDADKRYILEELALYVEAIVP